MHRMNTAAAIEVEAAEDRLSAYMNEHYGPLWGEENQAAASRLQDDLAALYARYDVPESDRVAL